MNNITASRRRDCLRRVAYWLRSCDEDAALESPGLMRRYINNARKALDELMLDMFGDEQEREAACNDKEGVA